MPLHPWKRGKVGSDAQVNKNPSKDAPEMRKGDGIQPLSHDPVVRKPYWEDAPKIIQGEK